MQKELKGCNHSIFKHFLNALRTTAMPLLIIACGISPALSQSTASNQDSLFKQYMAGANHKAYADSPDGAAGATWGQDSIEIARTMAVKLCIENGGYLCKVMNVNGKTETSVMPGYDPNEERPPVKTKPPTAVRKSVEPKLASSSTGFFVNRLGDVITNAHAVDDCQEINIRFGVQNFSAKIIAFDGENDLALLATTASDTDFARLLGTRGLRLGENVVVFGYPLSSVLSSQPKVTEGSLSSMAGLRDDSRFYQISAPIQPGNSGGPLLDRYGMVIGIVTSKLSDSWTLENVGVIPQNVNFALKASTIKTFLEVQRVRYSGNATRTVELSIPDVVEIAEKITVQIGCWK